MPPEYNRMALVQCPQQGALFAIADPKEIVKKVLSEKLYCLVQALLVRACRNAHGSFKFLILAQYGCF